MNKLLLLFFAVFLTSYCAFGQAQVKVINHTSGELYGLYTSGTEGDLLPESTLGVDAYATVTYPVGYDCEVTIVLTYNNAGTEEVAFEFAVDICKVTGIAIYDEYYVLNGEEYSYDE